MPSIGRVAIHQQSDLDSEFSLALRPMVLDDWDSDTYCAEQEEAEGAAAFENGIFAENQLFVPWVRDIVFLGFRSYGSAHDDFSDLPISGENPTPGVGSDEGNLQTQPNFLNPTNNEEMLDFSITQNSEVGTSFRGRYNDGSGVDSAGPDDNPVLTPAQRSFGSPEWPQAMREFWDLGHERLAA